MSHARANVDEQRERLARLERIWAVVRQIPRGAVSSYGRIAELAGLTRGARQVGYALRQLPDGHDVPWHRVVTASGRLAFAASSEQFNEQTKRLIIEGVAVRDGKIDMRQFGWQHDVAASLDELLWKPSDAWDDADR